MAAAYTSSCTLAQSTPGSPRPPAPAADPKPMAAFQGQPLTHEAAEGIKRGWLSDGAKQWSWLVASGKNPAYDYFPCQHQLYYSKGSAFWWGAKRADLRYPRGAGGGARALEQCPGLERVGVLCRRENPAGASPWHAPAPCHACPRPICVPGTSPCSRSSRCRGRRCGAGAATGCVVGASPARSTTGKGGARAS